MQSIRDHPRAELPDGCEALGVAKGVARSQIKLFKHEDYVLMYNVGVLNNVVNRRIGSKLHQVRLNIFILICMTPHVNTCCQMYTMERQKRGLCPSSLIRYLLADIPDGRPSSNIHAYGHGDLAAEEHLVADQPEPGAKLIIRHPEERFVQRHARVIGRLELAGAIDLEEEMPNSNADGEHHGDQLLLAERIAAAQQVAPHKWVT